MRLTICQRKTAIFFLQVGRKIKKYDYLHRKDSSMNINGFFWLCSLMLSFPQKGGISSAIMVYFRMKKKRTELTKNVKVNRSILNSQDMLSPARA